MKVWIRHGEDEDGALLGDFAPADVEAIVRLVRTRGVRAYAEGRLAGEPEIQVCAGLDAGVEIIYPEKD